MATLPRGKFVCSCTSRIHSGRPSDQTRPGSPVPLENWDERVCSSNLSGSVQYALQVARQCNTSALSSTAHSAPRAQPRCRAIALRIVDAAICSVAPSASALAAAYCSSRRCRAASLKSRWRASRNARTPMASKPALSAAAAIMGACCSTLLPRLSITAAPDATATPLGLSNWAAISSATPYAAATG